MNLTIGLKPQCELSCRLGVQVISLNAQANKTLYSECLLRRETHFLDLGDGPSRLFIFLSFHTSMKRRSYRPM